ncbi:precorrin-3B synthase [Planotetraspora sp. A-T 1434]|uniref:precorrin-3B synthase n=1 Tax=Planotetraspora sp. A-T 1434 TaxID=2979219 RepID=UPI0021C014B8|nr:precorrin-3B synthase [Planotetraspora sp. A-T 1434]MCT9930791.1 precorrin-3B synthase [Planotetraspora sp. A-T 1434]
MGLTDVSERSGPDACPGAFQTHSAADGAVARIRVPGGILTARQLRELGHTAASLGSGVIELTSRANVQIRGLHGEAERSLATRMAAAGLLPSATHERVRNILASPMAGLDGQGLIEVAPLVRELDLAIRSRPVLADLPGRFLFAVDDGRGDVAALGADIALLPPSFVLIAGQDSGLRVSPEEAVPVMVAAAEAFLAERGSADSKAWRIAELPDGPARIAARLGGHAAASPLLQPGDGGVATVAGKQLGALAQPGGWTALSVMPPLGRLSAAQAHAVATAADTGDGEIRLTPWRGVIVPGLTWADAELWLPRLADVGLITDASSPWTGVTACTGRPGCAKSLADVQADAIRAMAGAGARGAAEALPVHWAGCERRCGRPSGPAVLVVATGHGYRVDAGGRSVSCTGIEETASAISTTRTTADGPAGTTEP